MSLLEVTMKNFEQTVDQNEIVLLDFWASWCGPCRMFTPIYERVAEKFPEIVFGKVNTEVEQELAQAFQVRAIPTLMIFRQTHLVFEHSGLVPEPALEELIAEIRELDMEKVKKEIETRGTS